MWNIVAVLLYCVGFGLARIDLSKYFDDRMVDCCDIRYRHDRLSFGI